MTEREAPSSSILRQPEQRSAGRRLPGLHTPQAAAPSVAQPSESREQTLAGLRQAFAAELAQLEEQARQRGLAAAREDSAKALAQREQELTRRAKEQEAALDKRLEQHGQQLGELTRALDQERQQLLQALEPVAARLALSVVTRLLGQHAASRPLVADLAAQAIDEYRLGEPLRIRVSASDHARLRGLLDDEQALAAFQLDPQAKVGSCLIDHGLGRLDAGLDTQLDAIRAALLGDDRVAGL
ncbi:FliH/SctL family protein [Pseudomonas japonica]|uniref:Flagellar assembly protein FliH n=1 Tax=Pseudomonas japonica TaxID=256466 RepID=A0A239BKV6_9PSED|nr:FliH/SctL family protein [Pseudomonas japonica]SNS08219.1 Flagellar biosynthesis/type III secretory pathway protein FliH [Pseudomonas japonica]